MRQWFHSNPLSLLGKLARDRNAKGEFEVA
jgi:hypothetical protein